jgi:Tfp pilus assembly protein FimT
MKYNTPQSGLTLIELIVALSIAMIIVLSTGMVFTHGIKHSRLIAGEARLINQASQLTDVLTYHIRPATAVTPVANGIRLSKTDGPPDIIALSGGKITLNGTSILQPNITVDTLSFTIIDSRTVQVHYELSIDAGSSAGFSVTPFSATTTIAIRN